MRKSSKQINKSPSLFTYDERENILNLKAQLPHSFTLEKTLLTHLKGCSCHDKPKEIAKGPDYPSAGRP